MKLLNNVSMVTMRTLRAGLLAGVVLAAGAGATALGAEPAPNAALRYWPVFSILQASMQAQPETDLSVLWSPGSDNGAVEAARSFVQAHETHVDLLIKASQVDFCDWGTDYSAGPGTLLPYIGLVRRAARLLVADATMKLSEGDTAGAARSFSATMRLSKHATEGGWLISALVGRAVWELGQLQVNAALDAGKLDHAARAEILESMSGMHATDPFAIRRAIEIERQTFVPWVRKTVKEYAAAGPDEREEIRSVLLSLLSNSDDPSRLIEQYQHAVKGDGFEAYVTLLDGYYVKVLEAWDAPDAAERLGAIEREVEEGAFGELARVFAPAFSKVRQQHVKGLEGLAALRKRLGE